MRKYLSQFLSDKRVVDLPSWKWQPILQLIILSKRPFSAGEAYRSIWNTERDESPLLTITRDQCDAVSAQIAKVYGDDIIVDFAMRYGNPSVESVINNMRDQGVEKIVFFPCQCQKTTRLLKESLGWTDDNITTTFQSVFGREEWLRPYTVEHVAELARQGKKNIAVISPAFSADCIETLEEIQEEIQDAFKEAGGETFTYIPCLNDSADHVDMMMDIIQNELSGWV
ncbi:UNVERIFIED_CONTAM: hypothetical protein GTU68_065014 [Idotea baltica]|nr:hypothetical protein [Idotea baltica]